MSKQSASGFRILVCIAVLLTFSMPNRAEAAGGLATRNQVTVEAVFSDIGGGTEIGQAISFEVLRSIEGTSSVFSFGADLVHELGTGRAVDMNSSTGEVLYSGIASVDLYSLRLKAVLGYGFHGGRFTPYAGIAPVLVLRQSIEPQDTAAAGAFDDYHGYKDANVLLLCGFSAVVSRLVVDSQVSLAMFDKRESETMHGSPLQRENSMVATYRVGLGVVF